MAKELLSKNLGLGCYTIPSDPEQIPQGSAQDSNGWISTDNSIELCKGKLLVGTEETANGFVKGHGWGFRADGTAVHFRKINTKIQYYNTATLLWVDIVTGLTSSAEYTFAPYQSLAGTFIYATGADGIYKIHTANPASHTSLFDATYNFKGKSIIATARMHMWNFTNDKTGHYGSKIDPQNGTVYTTVTGEATGVATSGTLAFKASGAARTCFGVTITITAGGEIFTDNYNGVLTGSAGGTGTINYTTGAWTLSTSNAGTAAYQWENSNTGGITDFRLSATRVAAEGFKIRQDEGGDAIQNILIASDGSMMSIKEQSAYKLTIDATDLVFSNQIFSKNLGMKYWRAAVSTNKGIVFMDTANPDKPQLTILQRNTTGDNLEPVVLAKQFDFSIYEWDMCAMGTWGELIVFSGRTPDADVNNRLFLYNIRKQTVDIIPYPAKTITSNGGYLYIGDVQTDNVYEIFSGWDDDDDLIDNYWISNDEKYGSENLKKVKRLRFKGIITPDQVVEVYVSYDSDTYVLVGTIRGDGTYVDLLSTFAIGTHGIGTAVVGGETDYLDGGFYFVEFKLQSPKFRKRSIKFKATGLGFVSVNLIDDFNIRNFAQKLPTKYRQKQNTNTIGTLTDQ